MSTEHPLPQVKRREDTSVFVRWREGLFGLRAWKKEGLEFNVRPHYARQIFR